ncbi:hypothetical protein Q5H93_24075 [Hymenobacter sp. ASUV-10]|uniref:Uncharacterized protein n=1 Tax=Hymenobacter aranciens TaxID=3063996 RepID=A0ABT9BHU1_9BACT|nr:hypothetical protein [Hymenobacter sp. ASUV-10]MDO7877836.1 hypothetical protein [Hymenobacter sp. ASUV-10]
MEDIFHQRDKLASISNQMRYIDFARRHQLKQLAEDAIVLIKALPNEIRGNNVAWEKNQAVQDIEYRFKKTWLFDDVRGVSKSKGETETKEVIGHLMSAVDSVVTSIR